MIVGIGHVNRAMAVRDRMCRIADVAIERWRCGRLRRIEGKPPVFVEVQLARRCISRGPGIKLHPLVTAGLKEKSLFERKAALVLEPVGEPRCFNFLAEIEGGVTAEGNRPERAAGAATPAAMIPRPG